MSHKRVKASIEVRVAPGPTWETFKSQGPDIQPQPDWTESKIPHELQDVYSDINLPEKLKQISAWSLILDPSPPISAPVTSTTPSKTKFTNPSAGRTDGSDRNDHANARASQHSLIAESNGDGSESQSTISERSSRDRRVKPRYTGSRVLASTLSLLSTLKGKEGRQPPRSANEHNSTEQKASNVECTNCLEDIPNNETCKLPCNHPYCKLCLTTLITTAIQNESSFPPKCCLSEVPLHTVLTALNAKQREEYKEKAAEYAVPAQERWYCPNTKCLKWIPPSKLHRIRPFYQRCPYCATKICNICRGLAHKDAAGCPQDFGLEATLTLAELEGWRRCIKCKTMVEVNRS